MSGPRRADHERGAVVPRRAGGQRGGSVNRRAGVVWAVGLFAYIVAVFPRTSLGVAGVAPAHRFGVGALVLAPPSGIQLPRVHAMVRVVVGVRDAPAGTVLPAVSRAPLRAVQAAWSQPGTRLGLWTHFGTQFSACVFGVLWGYPFLVDGEGLAPGTAALLLSLLNVVILGSGPLLGQFVARWPYHRSIFALAIAGATAAVWTTVLLWPRPAPLRLVGT